MKVELPRRRWIVLAGCLAVIGGGLVLMSVDVAQRRYQRMVASYERVRFGMTRTEVRAAVGLPTCDKHSWPATFRVWELVAGDQDVHAPRQANTSDGEDGWVDHEWVMFARYRDGKAISKELHKGTHKWRLIANDWFAWLRRLFSP
jgi:hypothetical protein